MASTKHFPPDARDALISWFTQYGSNPQMEIEFRVQDVGEAGFERLLQSLLSNKGWSNRPVPIVTLDKMHATGVRETIEMEQGRPNPKKPIIFLRKEKGHSVPWTTPSGINVKFAVAMETECSADPSKVDNYRHKMRYTFVHKNLFKFELTKVKQGSTSESAMMADTSFEVELEFCGQNEAAVGRPEYLSDSMLMKAADLVQQLLNHQSGGGGGARKAGSSTEGPPQESDACMLVPGTEVALESAGQGAPPRFGGDMPAELAERTPWIFSHREKDTGRAYVMSEPTVVLNEHYPLFYFCGTVPYEAVRRRPETTA